MKIEIKQVDNVLKFVALSTASADSDVGVLKLAELTKNRVFSRSICDNGKVVSWQEMPNQTGYQLSLSAGPFSLGKVLDNLVGITELLIVYEGKTFKSVKKLERYCSTLPDTVHDLGTFMLSQEELLVSDPCYELDTWCAGTLKAKTGTWHAQVLVGSADLYTRVKELRVHHETESDFVFDDLSSFEDSGIDAGVDSGQCGFFDKVKYVEDAYAKASYEKLGELTIYGSLRGGILEGNSGAVTASGFGDGCYPVLIKKNGRGKVVAAVLRYIFEDDEVEE